MSAIKVEVQDLHFEHKLWTNELEFFAGELKFFEKRLGELVSRYREIEVLAELEHFQNQFIRQKEVLDKLLRDIHVHEQLLSNKLQREADITDALLDEHADLREQMSDYRRIYNEIKEDFFRYLAKWT